MGPIPQFIYYGLTTIVAASMLNWFFRRRAFMRLLKETDELLWKKLNPMRIPLAGFSDHSLEKFVAKDQHHSFELVELVSLGDKLKAAQRIQLWAVALLMFVFIGFSLYYVVGRIG